MAGRPVKRGPGWWLRFRIDGKATSRTFDTEADAIKFGRLLDALGPHEALKMIGETVAAAAPVTTAGPTVVEVVERYLTTQVLAPKSRGQYRSALRSAIEPYFAGKIANQLTRDDIRRWINWMTDERELSGKSVGCYYRTLAAALADDERLTGPSPCTKIKLPSAGRLEPAKFLTRTEAQQVIADAGRDSLLVEFLFASGARISETLALRPQDVDLARATVTFRSQTTKGGKARTIEMPPSLLARLDLSGEVVFPSRTGGRQRYSAVQDRWGRRNPPCNIHDCRHSHASWLLADGVPLIVVSKRLGHSSVAITASTYAHHIPGQGADAVRASIGA